MPRAWGSHITRVGLERRSQRDSGVQGNSRGLEGAERPGVDDFDGTSPESRQPLHPVPGEGYKGPTPETHQRWDACPARGDCLLRPLQEFHVQRAPRRLPNVGDSGDGGERQLLGRPPTSDQMGQEQGDSEGVHHTGPGGRSQDPLPRDSKSP